jgi:curved DNA-binding protein CbpA
VGPGDSHEDIVRAYRRLVHGVHPDAHPEDPEASIRFREITEAYEVLADPVRREAYDGITPSRRLPVQRRHNRVAPFERFERTTEPEAQPSPPPAVLGASKPRLTGEVLRVGPVRIGPPSGVDEGTASFAAYLFEILDSWLRR